MIAAAKPKRFACRYCKRFFARSEHCNRHERTHTKEKPYKCTSCSQGFARSDLLARHVRLNHSKVDAGQEADQRVEIELREATTLEAGPVSPTPLLNETEIAQSYPNAFIPTSHLPPEHGRDEITQLNAVSMVAEQQNMQELDPHLNDDQQVLVENQPSSVFSDPLPELGFDFLDSFDDYMSMPLDGPLFCNHIVPSEISAPQPFPVFEPEHGTVASSSGIAENSRHGAEAFSQQTTVIQSQVGAGSAQKRQLQPSPFSEPTLDDFNALKDNLKSYSHVIPTNFQLPTRLTLSKYLSAFIGGFHDHMPFLHVPTMSAKTSSVHLVLAVTATGAFYRFEPEDGNYLFKIAEAIVMEEMRIIERPSFGSFSEGRSDRFSLLETSAHPASTSQGIADVPGQVSSSPSKSTEVEIMQTLILLMAIATWTKSESMSRTAIRLQGVLASIIRQHGLDQAPSTRGAHWEIWAEHESIKRTKLIAFCFMNLQSLLYDIPSPIRPSEIGLCLPSVGKLFAAKSAEAFAREREQASNTEHHFQTSFAQLLKECNPSDLLSQSSLGNYVLIHAILQNMFYARELSKAFPNESNARQTNYLLAMERALRNWQDGWQQNSDRSTDLSGPIAFNCIALLRIAHIRLNVANGPCRALESRNPTQIARTFLNYPRPVRSPQSLRAVIHAAYALSIPVKIGLRFVAQTQAVFWSIQHSLCSLECAVLLSSWLDSLAHQRIQVTKLETKEQWVVKYVQSLLNETRFGGSQRQQEQEIEAKVLKRLSAGVVKVWAEVFRGPQTWTIVNVIGTSLELYGQLLEAG